ncbi:hypothetical protein [Dongia sp.]|uniref:hypothetical protein n=1 Tax=Dongia sp. TaxID=1977262 RepID=UPI003750E37F
MATYQTAGHHPDHLEHEVKPAHEIQNTEGHQTVGIEDARSAETTGHVRIILAVSFALAVICLGVVMLTFASRI